MYERRNLEELCRRASDKTIESKIMIEVLLDIVDGERKTYTMLTMIEKNLNTIFNEIESCRELISNPD